MGMKEKMFGDRITVLSRSYLIAEGIERMILCTAGEMIFVKNGRIRVTGEGLILKELGNDNIAVEGRIAALIFEETGL